MEQIDLRKEARNAIVNYYATSEGQDDLILILQGGMKERTLIKQYGMLALVALDKNLFIAKDKTEISLSQKGIQRLFELTDVKGEPKT